MIKRFLCPPDNQVPALNKSKTKREMTGEMTERFEL
jgi:hypothetical protein